MDTLTLFLILSFGTNFSLGKGATWLIEDLLNCCCSASYDSTVREWNDKGECMAALKGHEGVVLSMCVWRGHLFTGGCEEIKMWVSKTPTELESSPFTKHHHHHWLLMSTANNVCFLTPKFMFSSHTFKLEVFEGCNGVSYILIYFPQ